MKVRCAWLTKGYEQRLFQDSLVCCRLCFDRRPLLLVLLFLLDIPLVNAREMVGALRSWDRFDGTNDHAVLRWHRSPSLFTQFVEVMSEQSMASDGPPIRGSGQRSNDATIEMFNICVTLKKLKKNTMSQRELRDRIDIGNTIWVLLNSIVRKIVVIDMMCYN